jgi:hypothetical protein
MSLPVTDKQELFVNGYGTESIPQGISVKGSLWTVMQSYGKLLIKEYYSDSVFSIKLFLYNFTTSSALQSNGSFYTDRFWVWYINTSKVLTLLEIEPNIGIDPILHFSRILHSDVSSVSVYVNEFDVVRLSILSNSLPKSLKSLTYLDVKTSTPTETNLSWDATRQDIFTQFVNTNKSNLSVAYSNAASPYSIYTEDYSVPTPLNLTAAQVGSSASVQVDWNASVGSDQYVLERDTNASFPSPSVRYTGPLITFLDSVTTIGIYYYRVKARVTSIYLESSWSLTASAIVSLPVAPTGLAAVNGILLGEVDTSWNIVSGVDTYTLQRAKDALFTVNLTTVYTGATALFDEFVTQAATYYYRVRSHNILGNSSWSTYASVIVTGPAIPTNLVVVAGSFLGQINASWNAVPEATDYVLQRDKDIIFDGPIDVYTGSITSFTDTVSETATYYYRVKARNLLGDSDWSIVAFISVSMISITYRKVFASLRTNRHVIKQLDAMVEPFVYDDKYFGSFGIAGGGTTGLNFPNGMTVDFDNNIYICDHNNSRIVKLNKNLSYIGYLNTKFTIGQPCAIMFNTDDRYLYITGIRYHDIADENIYMYVGIEKCTTSFTDVKYSNDILGFYRRLNQRSLMYKPNSICRGFITFVNEYLITGVNKTIYRVIETLTGFSTAIEESVVGETAETYVGMVRHSNGYLYLNTGSQIIKTDGVFINMGDSDILAKTLYGLKQGFDGNLLTYNVDRRSLIAVDADLNYVDEFYIDSGDTPATSFYDTFDIAVNYVGIPRDVYSILNTHAIRLWASFSEAGHSTGYSPNTASQIDSSITRLQLINFLGSDQVSDGFLTLDAVAGTGTVTTNLTDNSVRITSDLTIIIWHKWDDVASSSGWMLDCSGPYGSLAQADNMLYGIWVTSTGSIKLYHKNNIITVQTFFATIFPRDGQQHMLMVRRNATAKTYDVSIDNGVIEQQPYPSNPNGGGNAVVSIGGKDVGSNRVRGTYSDAYIFSDLLNDTEIGTMYHYGPSEPPWFDYSNWNNGTGLGHVIWKVA